MNGGYIGSEGGLVRFEIGRWADWLVVDYSVGGWVGDSLEDSLLLVGNRWWERG